LSIDVTSLRKQRKPVTLNVTSKTIIIGDVPMTEF